MKRAVLAVFSGTGNATRAASLVAAELEESGWHIDQVDLTIGDPIPPLASGELLVLCTSILGFSVPSTVMQALKAAPRSEGAAVAILCVCGAVMKKGLVIGGWSGAAAMAAFAVLGRKGFVPAGSADVSYPENWTQVYEPAMGADQELILNRGDDETASFGRTLKDGRRVFIKRNLLTLTLIRFTGFLFRSAARRILAMLYIADDSCTSCGLCARSCPAGAIVMDSGHPRWTSRCSECNRCINLCPSASIQTSTARLLVFAVINTAGFLAAFPVATFVLGSIAPGWTGALRNSCAFGLSLAVYTALTVLQLGPLNSLICILEWKPAFRRFFTAGFTRRFRRYLAPDFKPGKP